MMRLRLFPLIFGLLLFSATATAQSDSLIVKESGLQARAEKPRRSPMGALLRSVAVPGWGQFYNHKYIKSGMVFGAETFFIVKSVQWWSKAEDQYKKAQSAQSGREFNIYLDYRDRRNDFLWLTGLAVFLSMFDAYVDAHLSGFDVDLTPDFQDKSPSAMLRLSYSFK